MAKAKRRRAQKQVRKNNTLPLIVAGAVVILVIGALIIFNQIVTKPVVADITVDYPTGTTEDGQPFKGKEDAPVVIEDFSDFRCAHCATLAENINILSDDYIKTGKVKVIFRNFAILGQGSINAALAAECALEQNPEAFWAYHDALFANQGRGESAFTRTGLKGIAAQIGLDTGAFSRCLNGNLKADEIQRDKSAGDEKGVNSTPTLFFNDEIVRGSLSPANLKDKIDNILAE